MKASIKNKKKNTNCFVVSVVNNKDTSSVELWADRPGASDACWNGNNATNGTTVPKPGALESPETGDAADYAYARKVGKETARDFVRAFKESDVESGDLSETVCNLIQDPTRTDIIKRGAVAGFLDEMALFTYRGVKDVLQLESGHNCLAIFGTRGFGFSIEDDHVTVSGHLAELTKAHHALSRLARAGSEASHIFEDDVSAAQDGLEFLSAMAEIFAKHADGEKR